VFCCETAYINVYSYVEAASFTQTGTLNFVISTRGFICDVGDRSLRTECTERMRGGEETLAKTDVKIPLYTEYDWQQS